MVSKKLLIGGGVATVGSVATAVVVASQNGAPSVSASEATDSPRETDSALEGQIRTDTDIAETSKEPEEGGYQVQDIEQSRENVRNWLKKNRGSSNWQIQIRKSSGSPEEEFEKGDPRNLADDYLNTNTELLKSLAGEQTPFTFIFENDGNDNWKIMPDKEQITKWIEKISKGNAILKLAGESKEKELEEIEAEEKLNELFEGLFKNKKVFENITLEDSQNKKNILFEQIKGNKYVEEGDWVHSKTEIEKWLKTDDKKSNRFEMKIKKGDDGETKKFDEIDEEDLIGLFDYLVKEENSALPYSPGKIIPVTLKMEKNDDSNDWNVVETGEDVQDTDQIT